jgi:hypothetical protein
MEFRLVQIIANRREKQIPRFARNDKGSDFKKVTRSQDDKGMQFRLSADRVNRREKQIPR